MLVFLDLETTGLDPHTDHVLEVACIVTDDTLVEKARFERVIYSKYADRALPRCREIQSIINGLLTRGESHVIQDRDWWAHRTGERDLDGYVAKMHWENGLWEKVRRGENIDIVDADLADFIQLHAHHVVETRVDKPQLAGSTISFDRGFLASRLPRSLAELHYRNLDVSTFNETAKRFWKPVYEARPKAEKAAHRGMADIEASIRVLRHYLASLVPVAQGVV